MATILVVDDEEAVCELLREYLTSEGYEVTLAENGRKALQQARENPPDLIVTDVSMPDMEGVELLRSLQRGGIRVPVLVMSGNPVGSKFLKSMKYFGASETLKKPFSMDELSRLVKKLLQGAA